MTFVSETQRGATATEELFQRRSSGLVRQVGSLDTFFFGITAVAIPYLVFIVLAWPEYTGASMLVAFPVTIVASLAVGGTYYFLSVTYARSGGEYVFVSRVLHPAAGFVVSFSFLFFQAVYIGINGAWAAKYGLAPTLQGIAAEEHSSTLASIGNWFSGEWGLFLTGAALVLLFGIGHCFGPQFYFRVQRWCLTLGFISMGVTLVVLLLGAVGALDFRSHFDAIAGHGAYAQVLRDGHATGVALHQPFSARGTANFLVWPAFAVLFCVLTVEVGGEIRRVSRSQLFGIPAAMIVAGLVMLGLAVFSQAAVGTDFLRAAAADPKYPVNAPPFINVFAFFVGNNVILSIVMSLWVVLLIPIAIGAGQLQCSRGVFAWSLDGVVPAVLSRVPERTHAPVFAVLVSSAVGFVFLVIYVFTTWIAILAGLLAFTLVFAMVMVTGLAFPHRKPELFEGSLAARRILGVPAIIWSSAIGLGFLAFLLYRALVDNTFGANTTISIIFTAVVVAGSLGWYYLARWWQLRRGLDIARRYREIPVE